MSREISPLTREEWKNLEILADTASQALLKFQIALIHATDKAPEKDPARAPLQAQVDRVAAAHQGFLAGYFYHPQPEWLGGDSRDPKNFAQREPHIVSGMCSSRRDVISDAEKAKQAQG